MKSPDWKYIEEMANDIDEDDERKYSSNELAVAVLWLKRKLGY